ncbi:MAG: hypothetical protein RMJ87_06485 [Cytophagales bacterium]|jgi:hypothetical protein|nr:hypothetical protein [Bernardetiaceae bacterium]MDW8204659.1 hypothetical protein [Cytophagales bacterium]
MTKEQITLNQLQSIVGKGIKQGTEGTSQKVLFNSSSFAGYGAKRELTEEEKYCALVTAVFEAKKLLESHLGIS